MSRSCDTCKHPRRAEIDAALLKGESLDSILERLEGDPSRPSRTALHRHKPHAKKAVASALAAPLPPSPREILEISYGKTLLNDTLAEMDRLRKEAHRLGIASENAKDLRTALNAVREQTRIIETFMQLAKVIAETEQQSKASIATSTEWLELRHRIIEALKPYPDAARALAEVLARG